MTEFYSDIENNIEELHEFLMEELELKSNTEIKILLDEYWKSLKRGRQKQLKDQATPDLETDYFS